MASPAVWPVGVQVGKAASASARQPVGFLRQTMDKAQKSAPPSCHYSSPASTNRRSRVRPRHPNAGMVRRLDSFDQLSKRRTATAIFGGRII